MKPCFFFLFIFIFSVGFAQQKMDSIQIKDIQDFQYDDYGNLYTYEKQNFSLTKYDDKGKELGRLMMTVPFKIQSVDNPLNIFLFSENAQQLKVVDQNLVEIQKIDFSTYFGFIKLAFAEDLQIVWLLDETTKRLVQFNYRTHQIIKSFQYQFDFDEVTSMLVFDQKLYITTKSAFKVYDLRGNLLFSKDLEKPVKLRRSNEQIFIFTHKEILEFAFPTDFKSVYFEKDAKIVDKNSSTYFVLKENKSYIYTLKN